MDPIWNSYQILEGSLFSRIQEKNKDFQNYTELKGCISGSTEPVQLSELIESCIQSSAPGIAILGDFGMGKSCFLEYLYTQTMKKGIEQRRGPFPVLLSLGDLDEAKFGIDWILEQVNNQLGSSLSVSQFSKLWKTDKAIILLLDGLDEIPDIINPEIRNRTLKKLGQLSRDQGKLLITARRSFFAGSHIEESELEGFSRIYIQPLSEDQIQAVSEAYFYHKREVNHVAGFYQMLESESAIGELAERPIFLLFLLKVYSDNPDVVVKNPADLYKRFVESTFSKEVIRRESKLNAEILTRFMEAIALEQFYTGTYSITRTLLEHIIQNWSEKYEINVQTMGPAQILGEVRSLLDRKDMDRFSFMHASVRDFFVAKKLANEIISGTAESFDKRALLEEIFEFILQILKNERKFERLYEVHLDESISPIARGNMIPMLRKAGGEETKTIDVFFKNLLNDPSALLRYMSGYSLQTFKFSSWNVRKRKEQVEMLQSRYGVEPNSLVRAQLALLIRKLMPGLNKQSYPELSFHFPFDSNSVKEIMVHPPDNPRIDLAYERIIVLGKAPVEIIKESIRILTLYTRLENREEDILRVRGVIEHFQTGFLGPHTSELTAWAISILSESGAYNPDAVKLVSEVEEPLHLTAEKRDWNERLKIVLEANFADQKFSVPEFAKAMQGGSLSTFRRKFKKNVAGEDTPQSCLLNYRLEKAKEYLKKGLYPSVFEVSRNVGFNDHAHFSKSFKDKFGVPPSKYLWRRK
ncbi:MAG: NACHT domain-containing protein [Saprospiraceae bacterium]|nr:NACHT domain-containing protein [Saprospiraceae bacterium]